MKPLLTALAVVAATSTAQSAIVANGVFTGQDTDNSAGAGSSIAATYSGDVRGNDLINTGQPTLQGTPAWSPTPASLGSGTANDNSASGTAGVFLRGTLGAGNKMPFTYTVTLNTSANTFGYDLQTIRVFAGWNQNGAGLANQKFELLVSTVGSATFTSLGTFQYLPFNNADTEEVGASKFTLVNDVDGGTAAFVTNVDQIQFVFTDHGVNTADSGTAIDGTVLQEIDVLGVASVPEPAAALLAGLGTLAILRRRRI